MAKTFTDQFGGKDITDDSGADSTPAVNASYKGRVEPSGHDYMLNLLSLGWTADAAEVDNSPLTIIRGRKVRSTVAVARHPVIPNAAVSLYAKGTLVFQNCFNIGADSAPDPTESGFRLAKAW